MKVRRRVKSLVEKVEASRRVRRTIWGKDMERMKEARGNIRRNKNMLELGWESEEK